MKLIPAIDLCGGRCVRLYQGDFAQETRYAVEPVALVERYRDAGHTHIHVVDLDGARTGSPRNLETLRELCAVPGVTLQLGGGLRGADELEASFALGVTRAVLGSIAIQNPDRCREFLRTYGGERLVFAFDVRADEGEPEVMISGWQQASGRSLWEALGRYADTGLEHVLCTDVSKDGAMNGPNLALYERCVERFPGLKFQASGGVRDRADLDALAATGVTSAIAGRALLERRIDISQVREC